MKRLLVALTAAGLLAGLVAGPVAGAPAGKTTICHMSDEYPYAVTITVSDNALTAHWAHGDYKGACVTTVTLKKAIEPTTDPGLFNLWLNGVQVATDVSNGGTSVAQTVGPNSSNAIAETAGTGTSLGDYTPSWTCTNGVTSSSGSGASGIANARAGRNTVCTFYNSRIPATVQVVKNTVPADSSLWGFVVSNAGIGGNETYQTYADRSTPFDSGVLTIADPNYIEIDEWAGTGYDIAAYTPAVACTDNGAPMTPFGQTVYAGPNGPSFYTYFKVQSGHAYVCTFTNTRKVSTLYNVTSNKTAWDCVTGVTDISAPTASSVIWRKVGTDVQATITLTGALASSTFDVWVEQNPGTCPTGTSTPSNAGAITTDASGNGTVTFTFTPIGVAVNFWLTLWAPEGPAYPGIGDQVLRTQATVPLP